LHGGRTSRKLAWFNFMNSLLSRFSFDSSKLDWKIWLVCALCWLTITACGVGSVFSHQSSFTSKQRFNWILLIVLLPLVGLAFYLPKSLKREGPSVLRIGDKKKKPKGGEGRSTVSV
jgi:hypothetical protein